MPIILIGLGLLAIISTLHGKNNALATQVAKDFTGNGSFAYWVIAVLIVGSVGYLPGAKNVSTLFLVLCGVSFLLSQNGVIDKATQAVEAL